MKILTAGATVVFLFAAATGCSADQTSSDDGPMKIMQIAPYESQFTSQPFMETSAQAAVDEINEQGGIGGRELELVGCNSKYDANETLRCAQMARREGVVAVVGSLIGAGAQALPVLEASGIASVGADAITPDDAKSSISFLFDAGVPGYAAMPAIAADRLDATRLASIHTETPSAKTNQEFFEIGAGLSGTQFVENIVVPLDSIDYTQFVSRAETSGAQAIISSMEPSANLKLWRAIDASGSRLKVVASAGSVTPELVREAGPVAEGSYVVAGTPNVDTSNEWGAAYRDAMAKYQPEETVFAGTGLRAYWAVKLFADVVSTIDGPVNRESVLAAFSALNDMDFAWVESLSFDRPGPIEDLPRVVSATTFPSRITDGSFTAEEAFEPFG